MNSNAAPDAKPYWSVQRTTSTSTVAMAKMIHPTIMSMRSILVSRTGAGGGVVVRCDIVVPFAQIVCGSVHCTQLPCDRAWFARMAAAD